MPTVNDLHETVQASNANFRTTLELMHERMVRLEHRVNALDRMLDRIEGQISQLNRAIVAVGNHPVLKSR